MAGLWESIWFSKTSGKPGPPDQQHSKQTDAQKTKYTFITQLPIVQRPKEKPVTTRATAPEPSDSKTTKRHRDQERGSAPRTKKRRLTEQHASGNPTCELGRAIKEPEPALKRSRSIEADHFPIKKPRTDDKADHVAAEPNVLGPSNTLSKSENDDESFNDVREEVFDTSTTSSFEPGQGLRFVDKPDPWWRRYLHQAHPQKLTHSLTSLRAKADAYVKAKHAVEEHSVETLSADGFNEDFQRMGLWPGSQIIPGTEKASLLQTNPDVEQGSIRKPRLVGSVRPVRRSQSSAQLLSVHRNTLVNRLPLLFEPAMNTEKVYTSASERRLKPKQHNDRLMAGKGTRIKIRGLWGRSVGFGLGPPVWTD
ncbi:hypothetical protein LTR37_019684 [Vermiconidia calcicola]|uniref:Uncharacterized protein n=1 Tax=Vermiconidia calcicola TaxID=1690605 RepID=A0ACC3MGH9_9PEZI|nr:hypothetical protein LTR37_019684 [Vermiconidia calcicola]